MRLKYFLLILPILFWVGCEDKDDDAAAAITTPEPEAEASSCDGVGTFNPSGYTYTITSNEYWNGNDYELCEEGVDITYSESTISVQDWTYVFNDSTVAMNEVQVQHTYEWCIDSTEVMTIIDDDGEVEESWTFTSNTDATSETLNNAYGQQQCIQRTYLGTATQ